MTESLAGKLLVASPSLADPNFARAVILVCSHDAQGAFGLVLNRTLDVATSTALPDWPVPLAAPERVFIGGPVDIAAVFALGFGTDASAEAWSLPVQPGLGVIDLTRIDEAVQLGVQRSRVYSGYAGWGAGQLEAEVAEEAWFVVDTTIEDIFTPEPDHAWRAALRRHLGALAMYAYFPDDPTVN